MSSTRFKIVPISQPTLGLILNQPEHRLDPRAWVTARNVRFKKGAVEKRVGWSALATTGDTVSGAISLIGSARWNNNTLSGFIGSNAGLFRLQYDDSITQLNAAPFLAATTDRWDTDQWFNTRIFTNYVDYVQKWADDAASVSALGGTPPVAKSCAVHANHLLLGNIYEGGDPSPISVHNSHIGDIEDWNEANPANEADLFPLTEGDGHIRKLMRLGNSVVAYKDHGIHVLNYGGPDLLYVTSMIAANRGCLSGYSVVDRGTEHLFIGQDNLYVFDGSTPRPFGDRVWQWLRDDIDPDHKLLVWAFHHRAAREVYWCYRSNSGGDTDDTALVWNYDHDSFSVLDWPFFATGYVYRTPAAPNFDEVNVPMNDIGYSFDTMTGLADLSVIGGDANGNLYIAQDDDSYTKADGNNVTATLESGDMDFGSMDDVKILNGMYIDATTVGGPLSIYVGVRDSLAEEIRWMGPYTYTSDAATITGRVNFIASGRWIRFKFTQSLGWFQLREYAPQVRYRGRYRASWSGSLAVP